MGRRRDGQRIDGWLVLDKPAGITSAGALARAMRLTGAAKGGHGGTLDPMATGVLPLAFGQATKTVAYVMDGAKSYRFTVRWGTATATDDAAGEVIGSHANRPDRAAILAVLPGFVGAVMQTPPAFAALKRDGERAYAIARRGDDPGHVPRPARLDRIDLIALADTDHATFEIDCGKGYYVRALARDMAVSLETLGHVAALRRLRSGPFHESEAISLEQLGLLVHSPALGLHLKPIETALADIPALPISEEAAPRILRGETIKVENGGHGRVQVTAAGRLLALAELSGGEIRPVRVFNP